VDGGEEISGGFVVARGDRAELFEFAEEILDQMALFVEFGSSQGRRLCVRGRSGGRVNDRGRER
jgi:hypothetical protein